MLGLLLLLPATGFLLAFFILPALTLFAYSVLTQRADGVVTLPLTLSHLQHFFGTSLYTHVLFSTLRMAAITAALAAVAGLSGCARDGAQQRAGDADHDHRGDRAR